MAEPLDTEKVKQMVSAMLCQRSGPVTEDEISYMIKALGFLCTNYTPVELDHIIIRTAMEKGDRPLQRRTLDG